MAILERVASAESGHYERDHCTRTTLPRPKDAFLEGREYTTGMYYNTALKVGG